MKWIVKNVTLTQNKKIRMQIEKESIQKLTSKWNLNSKYFHFVNYCVSDENKNIPNLGPKSVWNMNEKN